MQSMPLRRRFSDCGLPRKAQGSALYDLDLNSDEGVWSAATFKMLGVAAPPDLKGSSELWQVSRHRTGRSLDPG